MWRRIERLADLPTDNLFLVGVPPNIVGCGMIEDGKLVWPREGDSEEINGAEWWMPILPLPE